MFTTGDFVYLLTYVAELIALTPLLGRWLSRVLETQYVAPMRWLAPL